MMNELLPFLKSLISLSGLSGYEEPVRELISETWQPLSDEVGVSRLGSLHALRRGSMPEPRPSVLFAAHMDAIGLMVNDIVDGFLRLTAVGGVDARVLPGQLVTVHGREDLPGVIVQPPAHLLPSDVGDKLVPIEYLLVDVGLTPRQIERHVRVGDLISFAQEPLELGNDLLAGHSLDNRASVVALTECLQILRHRRLAWDVWAAATVQEEVNLAGALSSAYQLRPSVAVAIDVTFASGPGSPTHKTYPFGKGVTLGWGPNVHPALYAAFGEVADRFEIPYKMEVMPRHSGTDAMALQMAAEGIPTMVVGIPLRYMHTPVELISLKDLHRAGRLLAEFAAQLDESFTDRLVWE
jgi:endoglucanase